MRLLRLGAAMAAVGVLVATLAVNGCTTPQQKVEAVAAEPAPAVEIFGMGFYAKDISKVLAGFATPDRYGGREQTPVHMLTLCVHAPKKDLVEVDRVVVESYCDEKGTDISLGAVQQSGQRMFFPREGNVTEDHAAGFVGVSFPTAVPAEARTMRLKGSVIARCGGKEVTRVFANVPFKEGASFSVNGHPYVLAKTWSYDSSPEQLNFSVTSDGPYEEIRAVRFLSVDGKDVAGRIWRVDRFSREPTELLCEVVGKRPEAMRIEVDTYEKVERVSIPIDLAVNVGALGGADGAKLVGRSATRAAATGPGLPTVKADCRVVALVVDRAISKEQAAEWFGERESVSAFRHAGFRALVEVNLGDTLVSQAMPNSAGITMFEDNKGGDLLSKGAMTLGSRDLAREIVPISRDRHRVMLQVSSADLPGAGAEEIRFKGAIGVMMAEQIKTVDSAAVGLDPGTEIVAGGIKLKITAASLEGKRERLMMTSKMKLDAVQKVQIVDEAGKVVGEGTPERDRFRSAGDEERLTIYLPEVVEKGVVRLTVYPEGGVTKVPVEFGVGSGLG